jgi:hypothetical protein
VPCFHGDFEKQRLIKLKAVDDPIRVAAGGLGGLGEKTFSSPLITTLPRRFAVVQSPAV